MSHDERRKRRAEIAAFVKAGGSLTGACQTYGLTPDYVCVVCKEYGVDPPMTGRTSRKGLMILTDLLNTKDSLTVIGERHGVSTEYVVQMFKKGTAAGMRIAARPKK